MVAFAAVMLLTAIAASKASSRLGVPALLLFLLLGMLAGEDGPGGVAFSDAHLSQHLGSLSLALILFAGGLETDGKSIRTILMRGLSLSTIGVLLTALLAGLAASYVLGLSRLEGLLLGAIVSSTDAAAVFSVLRSQGLGLKHNLSPLLEFESGSNDPMAVFLTIALIRLLTVPDASLTGLAAALILQMGIGAAAGYGMGRLSVWLLNRIRLQSEGLYPVLLLALALLTFGGVSLIQGNGFLAIYVAGIVVGNADFIHKRTLLRFHDALSWLLQIAMFLTLGLLVTPSQLIPVAAKSMLLALFLVFVARPVAVFVSLAFARMPLRSKLMVSWTGLRGAVPIILATFPLLAGIKNSQLFFDVVFFIVLTSVLIQGTTLPVVARWLHVAAPMPSRRATPLEFTPATRTSSDLVEMTIGPESPAAGRQIVDLRLPKSSLIVLLTRDDGYVVPRGATVLRAGDTLLVLADRDAEPTLRTLFNA